MKFFKHLQRWWSAWLLATGLIWLTGLTALNYFQGYFGWSLLLMPPSGRAGIECDIVTGNQLIEAISQWTSRYVLQQFYPLILAGTGALGLILQNKRLRAEDTQNKVKSEDRNSPKNP